MKVNSALLSTLLAAVVSAPRPALADDTLVRLEARCPDKTIEYDISKHALAELQTRKDYKVVADNTAEIIIRFSASPVKSRADDKGPPLGVALATLVQRRTAAGVWEVKRFGSAFVPLDEVQPTVKGLIGDALK
jgi:hypothetical protein